MNTPAPSGFIRDHRDMREHFLTLLSFAGDERHLRDYVVHGWDGDEPGWQAHERSILTGAVNAQRLARDLEPVTDKEVHRLAECEASGHSDYAWTYALHCAQLAMGQLNPEATP